MGSGEAAIRGARRREGGGVLAEFAILGFVVWLLLAGVLEIGRALTAQQLIQHAARTIAGEMARLDVAHDARFEDAVERVIDTGFLVIDSDLLQRCGVADFGRAGHANDLERLFSERPIGNRLLRPLMISDQQAGVQMIRYPGALLVRNTPPGTACADGSVFTVGIAQVDDAAGQVIWHPVVERDVAADSPGADRRGFSLADGGWVGLRVNYPFQSAGLLAAERTGTIDPATGREGQRLVDANQSYRDEGLGSDPGEIDAWFARTGQDGLQGGVYGGPRGLGRVYSIPGAGGVARPVRPYRRVLSASAGFRREFFGLGGTS